MPVLSKPTKSAKSAVKKFDPAEETTVTYDGKQVSLLYEVQKINEERHFKIQDGTFKKVVPLSKLSQYAPQLRDNHNRWSLGVERRVNLKAFY